MGRWTHAQKGTESGGRLSSSWLSVPPQNKVMIARDSGKNRAIPVNGQTLEEKPSKHWKACPRGKLSQIWQPGKHSGRA